MELGVQWGWECVSGGAVGVGVRLRLGVQWGLEAHMGLGVGIGVVGLGGPIGEIVGLGMQ